MHAGLSSDDSSYFLNMSVIGATLLGLSFVALVFFLVDLFKRYEDVSLPVFRARNGNPQLCHLKAPASLTDRELLDGDPLVVFIAFSVAVTWNLFLLPLVIGLTLTWSDLPMTFIAVEIFVLFCILTFSFIVRNIKIGELQPYLTREELLWPYIGALALFLYAGTTACVMVAAFSPSSSAIAILAIWNRWGITNEHAMLFVLKGMCIVALLLGTYTTNKDMFIFFKSIASERMRQKWLRDFLKDHSSLRNRVRHAELHGNISIGDVWNGGIPRNLRPVHKSFKNVDAQTMRNIWETLVRGDRSVPTWMMDVPSVAAWADDVEYCLISGTKIGLAGVDSEKSTTT